MPSHITDSIFLKDLYGTDDMRAVFSDEALLQRWLDVEAALALAEAEIGVIPYQAAQEIARKAKAELIDAAQMKREIDHTLHPIVPLIRALKSICDGDAGEYIHWGATTQDIMDTALVLQLKDAIAIFERRLSHLEATLTNLAQRHRETIMPGRTHGQHALPITFGFKVAIWLDEFRRHAARLRECKPRVLVGQFGGAVGTLAGVGEHGFEIRRRMMAHLGLGVPTISWHVAHDRFTEFATVVAMLAGTCGKIAREVIALQKSEVMELEEPWTEGKVGSSTMPHKRNPMLCEAIVALARLCFDRARASFDGLIQEHERDWAVNHMEWAYLPELCIMADGALALTSRVLDGLHVYPERMRANVDALDGLIVSEAIMFALGQAVGRQTAHDIVYACAMRAVETKRAFREVLAEEPLVRAHLSADDLNRLLDPTRYLGLAREMVDHVCRAGVAQS
ncbi:MAG: adenylosuccinate lyase [Thermoflexales bacterium]|nr:adenylosuccinate lyase [Thermoflexales bacterium]MDW8352087.1 adenylosuccinate lyase [Anaerolineae bacterium]